MEARTADIGGPVHYVEYDGPRDGPPFVLVHGLGASHLSWMPVAPLLARRSRVFALDLAGFGRTPPAGRSSTVQANRALVDRFVEQVAGGPAILVGNSMGGLISILTAVESPHRVAGLVLVNPALPRARGARVDPRIVGLFAGYAVPGVGERVIARRLRALGPERLVRDTLRWCAVDPSRVDPQCVDELIALAKERAEAPWGAGAFLEATRSMLRILARRERFFAALRNVSAPALLIAGRHDRLVAFGAAQAVARARPDWEFVVFEDCAHVPQLEDPQRVAATIEQWMDGPASVSLRSAGLA